MSQIIHDLPEAGYFDGSHYGIHAIMDRERKGSRYFYERHVLRRFSESRSATFDLGKGAHAFILQGEAAYSKMIAIRPESYWTDPPEQKAWNARAKYCKEWSAANAGLPTPEAYPDGEPAQRLPWNGNATPCRRWMAEQEAKGLAIITADDDTRIRAMSQSLLSNPDTSAYLRSGCAEVTIRDVEDGVPFQCRIDWASGGKEPINWTAINDLKTCDDLSDFERDIFKYRYDRQGAHYQWMTEQATGQVLPFVLLAVETAWPHRCGVYVLGEDTLERAHRLNQYQYDQLAHCIAHNDWPIENPKPKTVGLPKWLRDADPLSGAA